MDLILYFLQLKSELGNKVFMIWATVSSQSCFCWLYRASPSLTTKDIISLTSVLTVWWCTLEIRLLRCWQRVFAMTNVFSWQNSVRLCPASFCTLRLTLPVTYIISWLPSFAVQSHMMKRTFFFGVSSRRSGRSSWNHSVPTSSKLVVGA